MSQTGENDLSVLLRAIRPVLNDGAYVFCTIPEEEFADLTACAVGTFRETEGITLIVTQDEADARHLPYQSVWAWITLAVHSSLSAVGFLAAVTARLANAGLPANPMSAFFHDHLFVPYAEREKAMAVLTP